MTIGVMYEDNHLLVVKKPAAIATQPDLVDRVKKWIKEKYKKSGNVFLHPIHRLDKPVGGLVLFARTTKSLSRLQAMMREQKIERGYYALIEGSPPQAEGRLSHFLKRRPFRSITADKGKEAVLEYRLLTLNKKFLFELGIRCKKKVSLIQINLVTGRYHQIRIQLATVGCPILGDKKYGSEGTFLNPNSGIALHHATLQFLHPITQEKIFVNDNPYFLG